MFPVLSLISKNFWQSVDVILEDVSAAEAIV